MKEFQLTDRVVVEVRGEECSLEQVAATLRAVAEMIEQGRKGGEFPIGNAGDVLWEHECTDYGFRMGNRSLIGDAYYGTKQTFEVCCVEREDLENRDFDTSKLTNEDMERIANKAGDLILEGCDYWTGVVEAARYWDVPTKEEA